MIRRAGGKSSSGTRERVSSAGGPRAVGVSVAQHRQDFTHAHMLISVPLFCSYNKHSAAIGSDSESHFVSAEAHWRDESLSEVLKLQLVRLVRHMRFLFSAACLRSCKT